MIPSTIPMPNIRRIFIPDAGMLICEADLSGADAQVVAWEAEDEDLKRAFHAGLKIHHKNAEDMWGSRYTSLSEDDPKKRKLYHDIKQSVHGSNYMAGSRTLAQTLGWTVHEVETFQHRWFSLHPGIRTWHRRVETQLRTSRTVTNAYSYRRVYFDRIDSVLPEALAWIPQSTVALTCFLGALQVEESLPWVEFLLQVHDSLVFQVPLERRGELEKVRSHLRNPIPYPDPLVISWDISISEKSWGDCKSLDTVAVGSVSR